MERLDPCQYAGRKIAFFRPVIEHTDLARAYTDKDLHTQNTVSWLFECVLDDEYTGKAIYHGFEDDF